MASGGGGEFGGQKESSKAILMLCDIVQGEAEDVVGVEPAVGPARS